MVLPPRYIVVGRRLTQQANRRPTRGRKPAGGRPVERRVRRHDASHSHACYRRLAGAGTMVMASTGAVSPTVNTQRTSAIGKESEIAPATSKRANIDDRS